MQRTIRPVGSSCASSVLPHRRFPPRTLGFPTFSPCSLPFGRTALAIFTNFDL
ncbi:hypothetical protein DsansV1_C44g0241161 [Dioscorea sansibarensis]